MQTQDAEFMYKLKSSIDEMRMKVQKNNPNRLVFDACFHGDIDTLVRLLNGMYMSGRSYSLKHDLFAGLTAVCYNNNNWIIELIMNYLVQFMKIIGMSQKEICEAGEFALYIAGRLGNIHVIHLLQKYTLVKNLTRAINGAVEENKFELLETLLK
jgi:hypothetical protein